MEDIFLHGICKDVTARFVGLTGVGGDLVLEVLGCGVAVVSEVNPVGLVKFPPPHRFSLGGWLWQRPGLVWFWYSNIWR